MSLGHLTFTVPSYHCDRQTDRHRHVEAPTLDEVRARTRRHMNTGTSRQTVTPPHARQCFSARYSSLTCKFMHKNCQPTEDCTFLYSLAFLKTTNNNLSIKLRRRPEQNEHLQNERHKILGFAVTFSLISLLRPRQGGRDGERGAKY